MLPALSRVEHSEGARSMLVHGEGWPGLLTDEAASATELAAMDGRHHLPKTDLAGEIFARHVDGIVVPN
jgi:hypothetical protein